MLLLLEVEELLVGDVLDVEPLKPEVSLPFAVLPPVVEVLVNNVRGHLRNGQKLPGLDNPIKQQHGDLPLRALLEDVVQLVGGLGRARPLRVLDRLANSGCVLSSGVSCLLPCGYHRHCYCA